MPAKPKILHLEDDPEWVEIVRGSLKEFAVLSAHNLKEAAQVVSNKHFDVAILDISLVPSDSQDNQGEYFLKALEGIQILDGKRIVILSAYLLGSNQDLTRKYFKYYKVFDAIPKQKFDSKEFRGIIEECLKQKTEE
jgi:CheY-like chemotaxis protein